MAREPWASPARKLSTASAADFSAAAFLHRACQSCDMPPSTTSTDPVMKEEILARQEQGRPGDFLRFTETMQRDLILNCRGRFIELLLGKPELAMKRSADRTRAYGIHADATWRKLRAQRPHQGTHCRFRGRQVSASFITARANTGLLRARLERRIRCCGVSRRGERAEAACPRHLEVIDHSCAQRRCASLRHSLIYWRGRTILARNGGLLAQVRHHPTDSFFQG